MFQFALPSASNFDEAKLSNFTHLESSLVAF